MIKRYLGMGRVAFISHKAGKVTDVRLIDYKVFQMKSVAISIKLILAQGDPNRINVY